MPMELTQSRIQKIWLPNDNRPALPRRCEYGHGGIPEGWGLGWRHGMAWHGWDALPSLCAARRGSLQHPCSIPSPRRAPASRRCPHPSRCHPVTQWQREEGAAVTWPRPSAGCGEVPPHAWPHFHSPLPAPGLKGKAAGCSPRTRGASSDGIFAVSSRGFINGRIMNGWGWKEP